MFVNNKKINVVGDRVMVKRLYSEETTHSGIFIPTESGEKADVKNYSVVAIGDGEYITKYQIVCGAQVLIQDYEVRSLPSTFSDIEYGFVEAKNILAIVSEEK